MNQHDSLIISGDIDAASDHLATRDVERTLQGVKQEVSSQLNEVLEVTKKACDQLTSQCQGGFHHLASDGQRQELLNKVATLNRDYSKVLQHTDTPDETHIKLHRFKELAASKELEWKQHSESCDIVAEELGIDVQEAQKEFQQAVSGQDAALLQYTQHLESDIAQFSALCDATLAGAQTKAAVALEALHSELAAVLASLLLQLQEVTALAHQRLAMNASQQESLEAHMKTSIKERTEMYGGLCDQRLELELQMDNMATTSIATKQKLKLECHRLEESIDAQRLEIAKYKRSSTRLVPILSELLSRHIELKKHHAHELHGKRREVTTAEQSLHEMKGKFKKFSAVKKAGVDQVKSLKETELKQLGHKLLSRIQSLHATAHSNEPVHSAGGLTTQQQQLQAQVDRVTLNASGDTNPKNEVHSSSWEDRWWTTLQASGLPNEAELNELMLHLIEVSME